MSETIKRRKAEDAFLEWERLLPQLRQNMAVGRETADRLDAEYQKVLSFASPALQGELLPEFVRQTVAAFNAPDSSSRTAREDVKRELAVIAQATPVDPSDPESAMMTLNQFLDSLKD